MECKDARICSGENRVGGHTTRGTVTSDTTAYTFPHSEEFPHFWATFFLRCQNNLLNLELAAM